MARHTITLNKVNLTRVDNAMRAWPPFMRLKMVQFRYNRMAVYTKARISIPWYTNKKLVLTLKRDDDQAADKHNDNICYSPRGSLVPVRFDKKFRIILNGTSVSM